MPASYVHKYAHMSVFIINSILLLLDMESYAWETAHRLTGGLMGEWLTDPASHPDHRH